MSDAVRKENRLEKYQSTQTPSDVISSCLRMVKILREEVKVTEQLIKTHIKAHEALQFDYDLLTSIPAVGPQLGMNMLVVLRSHDFESASQAAHFLAWYPWQNDRALPFAVNLRCLKLDLRSCICPRFVPDDVIRECVTFMKICAYVANLKWWQSGLLCES